METIDAAHPGRGKISMNFTVIVIVKMNLKTIKGTLSSSLTSGRSITVLIALLRTWRRIREGEKSKRIAFVSRSDRIACIDSSPTSPLP